MTDELGASVSHMLVANTFLDALSTFTERMDQFYAAGEKIESQGELHAIAAEKITFLRGFVDLLPFPDADANACISTGVDLLLQSATVELNSHSFLGFGRRSEVRHATALTVSGWDEIRRGIKLVAAIADGG